MAPQTHQNRSLAIVDPEPKAYAHLLESPAAREWNFHFLRTGNDALRVGRLLDADLWMIFDESLHESSQTVLTRRITIGAYSDRADDLVITPDIVVVNSQGRRILPAEERRRNQVTLSIWKLTQNPVGGGLTGDDALAGEIATKLDEAWARAGEFSPDQTYILLP